MDESIATRYWCHMCSQMVNPIVDVEIQCPFCRSGFVEDVGNSDVSSHNNELESDFGSERALSLWAPILFGMMENRNPHWRGRFRHIEFDDNDDDNDVFEGRRLTELDRELDSVIRRRRSSATILHLLQGIRAGMAAESENARETNRDRDRDRERERVILINPSNRTIVVQGGAQTENQSHPIGSLGDYFNGPALDLLLQHLAENDPNRYGTPPAQKKAVEALPTVRVEESLQCSVCLDDFKVNVEAKEMPCKHKFHNGCILPWLELHSSCPVCRYQLPADESKQDMDGDGGSVRLMGDLNINNNGGRTNGSGRRFSFSFSFPFSFPWPFNGLFSSQAGAGNSSAGSTSDSQRDETSI